MKNIALYSPRPQCGKSTVAAMLSETHGYEVVSFAEPMRAMIRAFLRYMGMSDLEIHQRLMGDRKEEVIPLLGKSARDLMRTIGTEWGRQQVKETLWVDLALERVEQKNAAGYSCVIDDLRYPNEYIALADARFDLVRLARAAAPAPTGKHPSDGALEGGGQYVFPFDIANDGTLDELEAEVRDVVECPL